MYNHTPDKYLCLFMEWTEWTEMNIFLNASEMIQNDQEPVQIDTDSTPAIL